MSSALSSFSKALVLVVGLISAFGVVAGNGGAAGDGARRVSNSFSLFVPPPPAARAGRGPGPGQEHRPRSLHGAADSERRLADVRPVGSSARRLQRGGAADHDRRFALMAMQSMATLPGLPQNDDPEPDALPVEPDDATRLPVEPDGSGPGHEPAHPVKA